MPVMPISVLAVSAPAPVQFAANSDVTGFAAMLNGESATNIPASAENNAKVKTPPPVNPVTGVATLAAGEDDAIAASGKVSKLLDDISVDAPALLPVALAQLIPVQPSPPPVAALQPASAATLPVDIDPPKPVPTHRTRRAVTDHSVSATISDVSRPELPAEPVLPKALTAALVHGPVVNSDVVAPAVDIRPAQPNPIVPSRAASVQQLFEALAQRDPIDRQWLDTVIRDVSVAASKTGDVRFRVEPDRLGGIMIERTADRLEIGVSEARSLAVVEAARPQILANSNVFGVPVSTSSVVHDQAGFRHRDDARPQPKIEHVQTEDDSKAAASDLAKYA